MGFVWREITPCFDKAYFGLGVERDNSPCFGKAYCGLGVERDNSPCFGKGVLWAWCGER